MRSRSSYRRCPQRRYNMYCNVTLTHIGHLGTITLYNPMCLHENRGLQNPKLPNRRHTGLIVRCSAAHATPQDPPCNPSGAR
jgi:hypothetical protein